MKKSMLICAMLFSHVAMAEQFVSLDVQRDTLKMNGDSSSQSVISATYSVSANSFVDLNLSVGTSLADDQLRVQTDSFRSPDNINAINSKEYRTSAEVDYRASVSASLNLPISNYVDAVASVGYSSTELSVTGFENFTDNKPTTKPQQDWFGLTECAITGVEERCGSAVQSANSSASIDGVFFNAGINWKASPTTTLFVGYRHEGDSISRMSGPMISFKFEI